MNWWEEIKEEILVWQEMFIAGSGIKLVGLWFLAQIGSRVAADTTIYGDSTAELGKSYCYRVTVFNTAQIGPPSNEACVILPGVLGGATDLQVEIRLRGTVQ